MHITQAFFTYDLSEGGSLPQLLVNQSYDAVFRANLEPPGAALVQVRCLSNPPDFPSLLKNFAEELRLLHHARSGGNFAIKVETTFNGVATTRFHLDGGPEQSILLLGYEPSIVESEVWIADYSKAAHDLEITPREFLERHNPIIPANESHLINYAFQLRDWNPASYQILAVNNSSASHDGVSQQGVLHKAVVRGFGTRVLHSILLEVTASKAVKGALH